MIMTMQVETQTVNVEEVLANDNATFTEVYGAIKEVVNVTMEKDASRAEKGQNAARSRERQATLVLDKLTKKLRKLITKEKMEKKASRPVGANPFA